MKKFIFRLPLVSLVLGAAIAAVASTGAFRKDSSKKATNYWVYISDSTSNFRDASKYQIQSLNNPGDLGCSNNFERPCVLMPVTTATSTSSGLQSYLNGLSDDNDVLVNAETTKD